ncbi:DUF6185 family protein [Streptomyces guryensis]|uniref:DUF6185 family protein n=1 Tax=Streptomyces guryensis TaxID=2886947 RepID=A0A9Q3W0G0_9ACTN|nr:DUF6185 family protein [Streptomyces guryensis]MCD9880345.1 DUF6185 family protein [Streptomyces guryensis]
MDRSEHRLGGNAKVSGQKLLEVLGWIQDTITEPVLRHLGHTTAPPAHRPWPRMWWCPVGPIALLPLHAAGHHTASSRADSVMDRDRLIAVGLDRLGALLWVATLSALLLVAVLLYRRRSAAPSGIQRRTLRNLAVWAPAAVVLFVLAHTDDVILRYEERHDLAWSWPDQNILLGDAFALGAVAVLFSFARPAWRFWAAGALLAVPPAATMSMPQWFGLRPSRWADTYEASGGALAAQTTASCCLMALTLLGCVAVAWRLAVDGGLLPQSRRFPGRDRVLQLRLAVPAVLVWTVFTAVCFALVEEQNWQRATWLSDRGSLEYGTDHRLNFLWEAVHSASDGQELILDHAWILTSLAVLAVLRTWRATPAAPSVPSSTSPLDDWADRLLFLAFFPLAVGLDDGHYVNNGLVQVIWIPLYLLALYGVVAIPARSAVLAQPLEASGRPLATVIGPSARATLLEKSRNYRETHAILRRLDQGLLDDSRPERKNLEAELDGLHDWPVSGSPAGERLPAKVSVVDASLALGPRDDWWANGVRGARFALTPGLPVPGRPGWTGRLVHPGRLRKPCPLYVDDAGRPHRHRNRARPRHLLR